MDASIFKFILRYSLRPQLILLAVTAASLPVLYLSLELPKTIVNEALSQSVETFEFFGRPVERLDYLFLLSGLFLALVFVNGGVKYFINVYRGVMAERMLRRLRYMLVTRMLRFPHTRFRTTSSGEVVAMVVQETEPIGGFFGEAFSLPAFQGGTLLTILTFMFIQDPILGAAAISLYPIQAYVIPKLQRRVNALAKQRVAAARKLSERIGETVDGVRDVHLHGTAQYELADFGQRLGRLFLIRKKIYITKFFIKFLNNFLNQLTPFFFFSIGGYLVIEGDLTLGALVAILAAYKDISAPWKELLAYYQRKEDTRVKYEQVVQQFDPSDIQDDGLVEYPELAPDLNATELRAENVSLVDDDGRRIVDAINLSLPRNDHVALIGNSASGRSELVQALARVIPVTRGAIRLGDTNLASVPDAALGRVVTYLDHDAFIRAGTIGDNLFYGLMQGPPNEGLDGDDDLAESELSGNSPFNPDADWLTSLDTTSDVLYEQALKALRDAGLEEDVFTMGLRSVLDADDADTLSDKVLRARSDIHRRIADSDNADSFEVFNMHTYNHNASVGENILFGAPLDERLNRENIATNSLIQEVLESTGLYEVFVAKGAEVAGLLADVFKDLPAGHEFFSRFSFFEPDDLPEYKRMSTIFTEKGSKALSDQDRQTLISLVFKLVPAQHRLGVIDEGTQSMLLKARSLFAEIVPDGGEGMVAFFDIGRYNPAGSISDNLLFGRVADANGGDEERVMELMTDAIEDIGLYDDIVRVGLKYDVGVGGKRLSPTQRQKLAVARALLKAPSYLFINDALAVFDAETRRKMEKDLRASMQGRSVLYATGEVEDEAAFDQVFRIAQGRLSALELESVEPPVPDADSGVSETEGVGSALRDEADVLRQVPFFESMSNSDLMLLAFTSERVRFAEGETIVRQGELGEVAFVIIDGEADVLLDASGEEEFITVRRRGDLVGELSLLTEAPRTATLRARTPVDLLKINRDVFLKLIEDTPGLSISLLKIISRRFEATLRGLSGGEQLFDTETRLPNLANFTKRLSSETGKPVIVISLTNADEIIDEIGASTEHRFYKKLVRRIRGALGEADTLARVGVGSFAAIISSDSGEAELSNRIKGINTALLEPMYFGARTLELTPDAFQAETLDHDEAVIRLAVDVEKPQQQ